MDLDLDLGGPRHGADSATVARRFDELNEPYRHANMAFDAAKLNLRRHGSASVVLTAPHAGWQTRNGRPKLPDSGTGGLAEMMAERSDALAITVSGNQLDDPNFDTSIGPFKATVLAELAEHPFVIDLHALRRSRPIDIDIGLGPAPDATTQLLAVELQRRACAAGFVATINDPFDARPPGTITAFAQTHGAQALQIEINSRLLNSDNPDRLKALIEWLDGVVSSAEMSRDAGGERIAP